MSDAPRLGECTLPELIEALSSDSIAPGAGAAAAVALALAAACAGKAVSISLKHHPADTTLMQARDRLAEVSRRALSGGDTDSARFEHFIHEKDLHAAEKLIQADEALKALAGTLNGILQSLTARIDPVVGGDIIAAQALSNAFAVIQTQNLKDNRRAAQRVAQQDPAKE
jgi:formiminotetrahydrofolate cyclodeaminase